MKPLSTRFDRGGGGIVDVAKCFPSPMYNNESDFDGTADSFQFSNNAVTSTPKFESYKSSNGLKKSQQLQEESLKYISSVTSWLDGDISTVNCDNSSMNNTDDSETVAGKYPETLRQTVNTSADEEAEPQSLFGMPLPFGFYLDLDFLRYTYLIMKLQSESTHQSSPSHLTLRKLKELKKQRRKERKVFESLVSQQVKNRRLNSSECHVSDADKPYVDTQLFNNGENGSCSVLGDLEDEFRAFYKSAVDSAIGVGKAATACEKSKEPPVTIFMDAEDSENEDSPSSRDDDDTGGDLQTSEMMINSLTSSQTSNDSSATYVRDRGDVNSLFNCKKSSPPPPTNSSLDESRGTLVVIRQQMAESLSRLKEYEKQIETIPHLRMEIECLNKQNEILADKLRVRQLECEVDEVDGSSDVPQFESRETRSLTPFDKKVMSSVENNLTNQMRNIPKSVKSLNRYDSNNKRSNTLNNKLSPHYHFADKSQQTVGVSHQSRPCQTVGDSADCLPITHDKFSLTDLTVRDVDNDGIVLESFMRDEITKRILQTEEEIMACPILQKAVHKVEEEARRGGITFIAVACQTDAIVAEEIEPPSDLGTRLSLGFVVNSLNRQTLRASSMDRYSSRSLHHQSTPREVRGNSVARKISMQSLNGSQVKECLDSSLTNISDVMLIDRSNDEKDGVTHSDKKLLFDENPQCEKPTHRSVGMCTEKWVEVITASKQTDTLDLSQHCDISPRLFESEQSPDLIPKLSVERKNQNFMNNDQIRTQTCDSSTNTTSPTALLPKCSNCESKQTSYSPKLLITPSPRTTDFQSSSMFSKIPRPIGQTSSPRLKSVKSYTNLCPTDSDPSSRFKKANSPISSARQTDKKSAMFRSKSSLTSSQIRKQFYPSLSSTSRQQRNIAKQRSNSFVNSSVTTRCRDADTSSQQASPQSLGSRESSVTTTAPITSELSTDNNRPLPRRRERSWSTISNNSTYIVSSPSPSLEVFVALKNMLDVKLSGSKDYLLSDSDSLSVVQQEWFRITSSRHSEASSVSSYLQAVDEWVANELAREYPSNAKSQLFDILLNLPDVNGNTALHYSVSYSNYDIVSVLIDPVRGANVDMINNAGYTCFMLIPLANCSNDSTDGEVIDSLFELASDLNVGASHTGQTALMLAASHGRVDVVRRLVNCKPKIGRHEVVDLNKQDVDGSTAIMCAVQHGHSEVVRFLLDQSSKLDLCVKDGEGMDVLAVAKSTPNVSNDIINMLCRDASSPSPSVR